MKINKMWTGKDDKNRDVVVYYTDVEGVKIREFGKPKYNEGDEISAKQDKKGFWHFDTAEKETQKTQDLKLIAKGMGFEEPKKLTTDESIARAVALKCAVELFSNISTRGEILKTSEITNVAADFEKWLLH